MALAKHPRDNLIYLQTSELGSDVGGIKLFNFMVSILCENPEHIEIIRTANGRNVAYLYWPAHVSNYLRREGKSKYKWTNTCVGR